METSIFWVILYIAAFVVHIDLIYSKERIYYFKIQNQAQVFSENFQYRYRS